MIDEINKYYQRPRYPIFDSIDDVFFLSLDGYRKLDLRSKQLGIMDCIRTLDLFFFLSTRPNNTTKNKQDYEQALRYGYPTFLRYLYEDFSGIEQCLLRPSTENSLPNFINKINIFSFKGLSDNYQELLFIGEIKVESYHNKILQLAFTKNPSVELIEREFLTEFSEYIQNLQNYNYIDLFNKIHSIVQKMIPLVYVSKKHFIGYETTEEIDNFFYDFALADTIETPEWNAFPPKCTFGGIPYEVYVDIIICFVGFSIKHLQYCLLLLQKDPSLKLENILSVIENENDLLSLIKESNGLSLTQSQQIISLISINETNVQLHTKVRSAAPPLVRISKNQYIRSICGCLDHPFSFLLDSLRETYPKDWDANTSLRESEFRTELYNLFSNDHTIYFDTPIVITKNSRRITDIDACMADKITGEILLFQLKWQDLPYASNQKCFNRKLNFEKKTMKWMEAINQWINTEPTARLADILKIPSKAIHHDNIKLVVIGRFNSNYTDFKFPNNAVWGQWYQIFLNFSERPASERTIGALFHYLRFMNNRIVEIKTEPSGIRFQDYILQI